MSTVKKVTLAILGFLVSAAMAVTALFRYRAASADKKIHGMEIADAADTEKQEYKLQELAKIKLKLATIPGTSVKRSDAEVIAELKRKGLLK